MNRLQIGFIGAGTIANWHADRISDLGHEIQGVADINPTSRRTFADQFGVQMTYEEYEEMITHADLDVVVVSVPNALHAECAIAALEADLDVFVEKPLAHSLEAAQAIAAAEADSEGKVFVGFMKAFDPNVESLRTLTAEGEFGTVYEVDIEYVRRRGIPQIGSWFTRKETAGGGVVIDIGVHMIHLALSVLDFPAIETVSASTGAHFGSKDEYTYLSMWGGDPIEGGEFSVEDKARALIRTEDGVVVHLDCAWAGNCASSQSIQVLGTEAGASLYPETDRDTTIYSSRRSGLSEETLQFPEQDLYAAEWEYFTDVLAGNRDHTRNTLEEGMAVQRVVDAIYQSSEQNREISLEAEPTPISSD